MNKLIILSIFISGFFAQACISENGKLMQIKQISGKDWSGIHYFFNAEDGSKFDLFIDSAELNKSHQLSQDLNNGVGQYFKIGYRSIKNDRNCFINSGNSKNYQYTLVWQNIDEVQPSRID